jgi:NTP pyrophosphatase (non-canonical NTP hydrolase)
MELKEFQTQIERIYLERDRRRGVAKTWLWFAEEVGELARAIRREGGLSEEFADCLAWLVSLASLCGVDIEDAIGKYAQGCPKCGNIPCSCPEGEIG